MKPSFALNLTSDGVALLHRTPDGWNAVGDVPFASDDLSGLLRSLRVRANDLAPQGLTTKIVIPNSQILYTEVDAPGPDNGSRRSQIRAALEGLTPYDVKDLVFDWEGTGPRVKVAVVARETLQEAEAFAEEHDFKPLSFVATPEAGGFGKEPWFGITSGAPKRLPKGEKVERDLDPIVLAAAVAAAAPAPQAEPALPDPETVAARFTDVVPPPEAEPAADLAAAPTPDNAALPEPQPDAPEPEPSLDLTAPVGATPETAGTEPAKPDLPVVSDAPLPHALDLPPFALDPEPAPPQVAEPVKKPMQPSVASPEIPEAPFVEVDDVPDMPPGTFASRRGLEVTPEATAPPPGFGGQRSAKPTGRSGEPAAADRSAMPRPPMAKPFGAGPAPAAQRASGASVTAPSIPGSRGRKTAKPSPVTPPPRPPVAAATNAVKPDTIGTFGARQLPQRGKPRYLGLILTVALLLVLALIAAWSSYYVASNDEAAATDLSVSDTTSAAVETPAIEDEMLADLQDPADLADAGDGVTAAPEETAAATDPAAVAAVEPAPAGEGAAVAPAPAPAAEAPQVSGTGNAPLPTPADTAQDEIFLTAMDPALPQVDALDLPPPPLAPDAPLEAQVLPPPFGAVYQFDAAGMIVPTAEGVVAPGGFTLIAGKPTVLPPSRPVSEPAAAAPAPTTSGAIVAVNPAAPPVPEAETVAPYADPALVGARPRSRPASLAPAPTQAEDDAALPEDPATRITSLRPRGRPGGIVPEVENAQQAAQSATLMMAAAPAPRPPLPAADATVSPGGISPLAISVSRKPAPRPSDFSNAIEAAVAAVVRQPDTPAVKVQPEEEEEPEVVRAVAPKIPTRASVAQQATFANAINLSKTNLIGVYGTASKRYALVRQSNGKYRKVSVGDRLDGGVVAAITSNELRYRKGSRMLALEMPRG